MSLPEKTPERKFWEWFLQHREEYHFLPSGRRRRLFGRLLDQLHKINKNLTFEFSDIMEDGKRELVISAGGIISAFPSVAKMVEQAPEFQEFKIVAFRQRKYAPGIVSSDEGELSAEDITFDFEVEEGVLDVTLFIKDYEDQPHLKQGAYILMDSLLGEYDLETKVGAVIFRSSSEGGKRFHKLKDLPLIVDEYYKKR